MGMVLPEYIETADWIVTLPPLEHFGSPPARRMARLLKSAIRAHGFRATDYYQPGQYPAVIALARGLLGALPDGHHLKNLRAELEKLLAEYAEKSQSKTG